MFFPLYEILLTYNLYQSNQNCTDGCLKGCAECNNFKQRRFHIYAYNKRFLKISNDNTQLYFTQTDQFIEKSQRTLEQLACEENLLRRSFVNKSIIKD